MKRYQNSLTSRPFRYLGPALLLFLLSLPLGATLPGEQGKLFVESFTPDDYGGHPQNWSVVQDERGIVYVANLEGVLEYDGARWRKIDHPGRISAWAVARDRDGTIFIGASGDLGYLSPDRTGRHHIVSLLDQVPEPSAAFGSIRQVLPTPDGVFFLETGHVFRWSHGEMTAWSVDTASSSSNRFLSTVDQRILLARQGEGILELRDGSFELVPGTDSLGDRQVTALLPLDDALLVATSTEGLFLYGDASVRPWEVEAGAYARDHRATGVSRLSDGRLTLSTAGGGVALFDRNGAILRTIDKTTGLPSNSIRGAGYEDAHGGLWLPLNHGVARVEVGSALQYFDDAHGLDGLVLTILRHQGTLYVGTTQGLFVLRTDEGRTARFVPAAGLQGGCGDLLSVHGRLLAATSQGLVEILRQGVAGEALWPGIAWTVAASRDGERVFLGTGSDGLRVLAFQGDRLVREGRVTGTSDNIRRIVEDDSGRLWLWAFTPRRTERIERVDPNGGVDSWPVTVFDAAHGIAPEQHLTPFSWQGQVFVATPEGIYRLMEDRFEPAAAMNAAIGPQPEGLGAPTVDALGRLWFYGSPYRAGLLEIDEGRQRLRFPMDRARVREYLTFYSEEDGTAVWAGGFDGRVIRHDTAADRRAAGRAVAAQAVIRNVSVAGPGRARRADDASVLPFASNSLRFEYALPRFDAPEANAYQSRLLGLSDEWSPWSSESYRDFTELWEDRYRFEVRGRDVHGRTSETAAFEFRVLPPWYRTWWAYGLYGLAFAVGLLLFVRLRLAKAERQHRDLERLVEERTARLKILSGLLPICVQCKKIRDDEGYWNRLESYIDRHSEASFSHGLCPDCVKKIYPDLELD